MADDKLLLQSGFYLLLEDGTGGLLLEPQEAEQEPQQPAAGGGGWGLDPRWKRPLPKITVRVSVEEEDDVVAAFCELGPNPVTIDNDLLLFAA
jgi:hypothetical protein